MQFLKKIFFSTKTTAILFLLLSISMATATFIESKYSTSIAKTFIYESIWFEILILLIALNLIGNIYKYKLWNKKKIPVLIFHLSFILIIIGGFFSRYFSNEGTIYLRKGFINNKVIYNKNYIKIGINYKNKKKFYYEPYSLSYLNNKYKKKFFIDNKNFLIMKIINYIPCAKISISKKNPVEKIIKIVSINNGKRVESFIKNNRYIKINKIYFSLNKNNNHGITIFENKKKTYIKSIFPIKRINMINGKHIFIRKNKINILKKKCLYETYVNYNKKIYWVIPEGIVKGNLEYVKSCEKEDEKNPLHISAITANINFHKKNRTITFISSKNNTKMSSPVIIDNYKISIGYGCMYFPLPFYLRLNNFVVKNYPGSDFPSFYVSNITLKDNNTIKNYKIYMNNILKYKGYRLFQSGYDPDKKGTHIIVNNDYLGTIFSYLGYFFMVIGMFFTMFWRGSRFNYLINKLKNLDFNKNLCFIIFILTLSISKSVHSEPYYHNYNNNSIIKENYSDIENISDYINISKKHADKFGRILVQDYNGRIKPVNTIAIELLRKIHKKDYIGNINATQWFISIHQDNVFWMKVPFISIDKNVRNELYKKIIIDNKKNYVSLMDFYTIDPATLKLKFILQEDYEKSFSKDPSSRNEYEKSILRVTERIGIIHGIFQGKYIRIFPIPNDINQTWSSWIRPDNKKLSPSGFILFNEYLKSLFNSQIKKNWNIADKELNKIKYFQNKYSRSILPTEKKISAEIIYNKINVFYYLMFLYAIVGFFITLNSFLTLFMKKKIILIFQKVLSFILFLLFICNLLGLVNRWYISNHAPWTNAYESAIFISFCISLTGFLLYRNKFVLGLTSLSSSIILMVAHGNIMDPEITNLVPVLKSNWLIIHVATITSSYGFFFTGSVLGILVLIFYIIKRFISVNRLEISKQIEKLTLINEICLTIGLFLLTIGTILGAIWANNSWGRYWSWDPKETWALISIMIYAFVLHLRLIPFMKKKIFFNFFSVLSIISIIMTYFGVNYYLSGLHSYAKGESIFISKWIYFVLVTLFIIFGFAYYLEEKEKLKNLFYKR